MFFFTIQEFLETNFIKIRNFLWRYLFFNYIFLTYIKYIQAIFRVINVHTLQQISLWTQTMISLLIIIHAFTMVFLISNHLLSSECQTVVLNKLINKYILKFNCIQLLWIILIIQAFHQKFVRETASVLFLNRSLRSWILISSSPPLVV